MRRLRVHQNAEYEFKRKASKPEWLYASVRLIEDFYELGLSPYRCAGAGPLPAGVLMPDVAALDATSKLFGRPHKTTPSKKSITPMLRSQPI